MQWHQERMEKYNEESEKTSVLTCEALGGASIEGQRGDSDSDYRYKFFLIIFSFSNLLSFVCDLKLPLLLLSYRWSVIVASLMSKSVLQKMMMMYEYDMVQFIVEVMNQMKTEVVV